MNRQKTTMSKWSHSRSKQAA